MIIFRKAARDISIVAVSYVVMWAATLVFTVAQARYLGPARFGELSLALAYAAFLSIFIDFGLGMQLSRMVAQRVGDQRAALADTMVIRGALWLLAMPGLWLATIWFGYDPELRGAILILAVSVLFTGATSTVAAYLQGREEFLLPSVAAIAQRITAAGVGVLALLLRPDLGAVACAFVVAAAVNVAIFLVGLRSRRWLPPRIDPRTTLVLFGSGIPLGFYWIATAFYLNVDMVMMQRLAPAENLGWYAGAYRLFNAATIVPSIVAGMVLYPILSRLSLGSRAELRKVIEKALTFLILTGVALAVVLGLFAERIVAFLYPAQAYSEAANALRLLAPGLLFLNVNSVFGYSLLALHQERRLLIMATALAVLNPLANFIAIPLFRQEGAALITSLTELGMLVMLVRAMPRDLLSRVSLQVAAKAGVAAVAAGLIAGASRDQPLPVALLLPFIAYGAAALGLQAATPADLRAVRALLGVSRSSAAALESIAQPVHEKVA